jgi:TIR domain
MRRARRVPHSMEVGHEPLAPGENVRLDCPQSLSLTPRMPNMRDVAQRSPYRPHVFISYYSRGVDAKVAKALRGALSKHRVRVDAWRDRENLTPGTKFILELQKAIATCDFFILLLSPRSVGSEWCRKEWLRAIRLKKYLIVLFLEDVSAEQWPLELEGLQYIDTQRGLREALPSLFSTLGVEGDDDDPLDDPLDRDSARMEEFANFFY